MRYVPDDGLPEVSDGRATARKVRAREACAGVGLDIRFLRKAGLKGVALVHGRGPGADAVADKGRVLLGQDGETYLVGALRLED